VEALSHDFINIGVEKMLTGKEEGEQK